MSNNLTPQEMTENKAIDELLKPVWLKENVIVYDWCRYNGEVYFAVLNWDESEKRQKPVLDLAYCATRAMNGLFLKQRVWSKRFTNSH